MLYIEQPQKVYYYPHFRDDRNEDRENSCPGHLAGNKHQRQDLTRIRPPGISVGECCVSLLCMWSLWVE